MKRSILVALVVVMVGWTASGQTCLPGGITFSSQSEIDGFASAYPGCIEIEGDVSISGSTIVNLDNLLQIKRVLGNVTISGGHQILDCSGLDSISYIGGNLSIEHTDQIETFDGFNGLDSIGGELIISHNGDLSAISGFNELNYIGGTVDISNNSKLSQISGFANVETVRSNLIIKNNPELLSFQGFSNLSHITQYCHIEENQVLFDITGLSNLQSTGGYFLIGKSFGLTDLQPLNNLHTIGGYLALFNTGITNISGLGNLSYIGDLVVIQGNPFLTDLIGLEGITTIRGGLMIQYNGALLTLSGLENLNSIIPIASFQIGLHINANSNLENLTALSNLTEIQGGGLTVGNNPKLTSLEGLGAITTLKKVSIYNNDKLSNLIGLEHLTQIDGSLEIYDNDSLRFLNGLNQLSAIQEDFLILRNPLLENLLDLGQLPSIGRDVTIQDNASLSVCEVLSICNHLIHTPDQIVIGNNADGCNSPHEVEVLCGGIPTIVNVFLDLDEDCTLSPPDAPAPGMHVRLNGPLQISTRPTDEDGAAKFGYLGNGPFFLNLPQFPTAYWGVCQDTTWLDPANFQDTIQATLLLQPLAQCPDLSVNLNLPPSFRGCLVNSNLSVDIQNVGTIPAENTEATIVLPLSVLEVLSSSLPITAQNGDTLFFAIDNLAPFETTHINLVVRTRCDTFLLGQTLCLEAFATAANACSSTESFSEVRLYSECLDDETVRFTLRNIGNAPTQSIHEFVIIEDEVILMREDFNLDPNEERIVDMPATGATYRMEATRFDNGVQTAIALENCGGLTPGLITAHWLDEGLNNYDYACAEVILAYDPNQKTAIPKGVGESHLTAANRPIQYTIEFQNTGTDTAFRVLLTDILSPHLDVNTFRPGFSSHPYSWEIRGADTLNVLFFPIALPDSNVNVAGSQGFFTFDIDQKPDLPDGTVIENTASIVFDFNPPIVTNTTFHTIGELVVSVDEPAPGDKPQWKVFANPVKATATFQAISVIPGQKRFELFDAAGRKVRTERFDGQEFLFQRQTLLGGLYFFKISDEQGRISSGKVIIAH